jgi:hypothetical protein
VLTRVLRLRPFLWPIPLVIAAYIGSLWLERGISYDVGGLGALVVSVMLTLGAAGLLLNELLTVAVGPLYHESGAVALLLSTAMVIVACLPYLALDAWTQRVVRRRTAQG